MKKIITVLMACFNEEENVDELYRRLLDSTKLLEDYEFNFLFIDNCSEDQTVQRLDAIAQRDHRVTIIVNNRNFGHIRSPYWGFLQSTGDATIAMASDLQDPPELIGVFLKEWELGWKVVLAVKPTSKTSFAVHFMRKAYYSILSKISSTPIIKNTTGFGLYDRAVIDCIKKIGDPYPYLRGLISEIGFPIKTITFEQPRRFAGVSSNNIYSLYDMAMLGLVNHSIVPIRAITFSGFILSGFCIILSFYYLIMKIFNWNQFPHGFTPLAVFIFFLFGFTLISLGMIGEYIASIHRFIRNIPVVTEKNRINYKNINDK